MQLKYKFLMWLYSKVIVRDKCLLLDIDTRYNYHIGKYTKNITKQNRQGPSHCALFLAEDETTKPLFFWNVIMLNQFGMMLQMK